MKHKDFGQALRTAREEQHLSARAVGVLTGISYSSISRYENGGIDPSFIYMTLLCDLYAIDLNEIANIVRPANHLCDQDNERRLTSQPARSTSLGKSLREGRETKGLSTRAVGAMTGVSYVNVSRYESEVSMPSFTAVVKLCDLYGIAIDGLADIVRHRRRG